MKSRRQNGMANLESLRTLPVVRFSLREMFIAVSLVSLHAAALGVVARNGGANGLIRVASLAVSMVIGITIGVVLARRSSTFRAGLPYVRLSIPRLRPIRLWQSAAVPVVALVSASFFRSDGGEFPFVLVVMAIATAASGIGLILLLFLRTLSICENGIEAEGKFVSWRKFERQGWCIQEHDMLMLGSGMGEYQAVVPTDRRADVDEFLRQKLGEPRGG
jgi:hypothetical protein